MITGLPDAVAEIPVLIPAYRPAESMGEVVAALLASGMRHLVVVDDGSGAPFKKLFDDVTADGRVHLVRHAVNLGKGAALKTGMNYALVHFPSAPGLVTADADGQHHPEDIVRTAQALVENPGALIMGSRTFSSDVPWKSRIGNNLTRGVMHLIVGQKLADTQTGLRGIPASLMPHLLRVTTSGYEFELDMLMACKHQHCPVVQIPIRTIYVDNNRGSHFRPLFDSMKIYFLLLRFSALSLLTALLDNLAFALMYSVTGSIGQSQIVGRCLGMIVNYLGARRVVFHSRQRHGQVFPKYLALVVANGFLSYIFIQFLHFRLGMRIIPAKLLAEGLLFIANFAIQRDFVFTRSRVTGAVTDWDEYYRNTPFAAKAGRRYTARALVDAIRRHAPERPGAEGLSVVEWGAGNSSFVDSILAGVRCRAYRALDNNRYGLSLLSGRMAGRPEVTATEEDVLRPSPQAADADVVLSVGLVEHFDAAGTRAAIGAHFDALRPGGIALIAFPAPTPVYRAARGVAELLGLWRFPDERPLEAGEVRAAVVQRGDVIEERTLWALALTQRLVVARKRAGDVVRAPGQSPRG